MTDAGKFFCVMIGCLALAATAAALATTAGSESSARQFDLYIRPPAGSAEKPAPPIVAPAPPVTVPAVFDAAGRRVVDFAELAGFVYTPPPDGAPWPADTLAGIPDAVRELGGRRVIVSGFMLPIKSEAGRVTQFLILRNQMACCYGVAPAPNEWIVARSRTGVAAVLDTTSSYAGILRVGARREEGSFIGIYELELE